MYSKLLKIRCLMVEGEIVLLHHTKEPWSAATILANFQGNFFEQIPFRSVFEAWNAHCQLWDQLHITVSAKHVQ